MSDQRDTSAIGDDLVRKDIITREELAEAREREAATGIPWYRSLLQAGKLGYSVMDDALRYEFHPKARRAEHQNIGNTLLEMKAITRDQLNAALKEQKRSGRLLGNILLDAGIVSRRAIAIALSKQHGMEFAELDDMPTERAALEAVPESIALKNEMIPVRLDGDRLTVLVADPQTRDVLRDASVLLGMRLHPVLTVVDDIREEIRARYRGERGVQRADPRETSQPSPSETKRKPGKTQKEMDAVPSEDHAPRKPSQARQDKISFDELRRQASGMPVITLVNTIIDGAVNCGATDVHLDPQEPETRVRYRIDGVLHDVMGIAAEIESAVVSRIKIMADMDVTETRRPQDGHFGRTVGRSEYDVRVATLPTYLGERVVLRLLDQSSVLQGVRDLGLEEDDQTRLLRLIEQPYGMILVTGPTGSGKTTTLYAALNQKNVLEESIVTLEDPIEYQLSGINQVQIDPDIGVTFATTLRAALRQDIDVLLVGEIRDPETARIAIRAAMTGHLVFSTMHTNDAPEAISTLRNMGVPSYLIASALTAIVAQRLVRTICSECKAAFTPDKDLLHSTGLPLTVKKLWRGAGCDACYHTGNRGRTGIFELLEINDDVRSLISADEPTDRIAREAGLETMAARCRKKLRRGIVAPEEFLRVIRT